MTWVSQRLTPWFGLLPAASLILAGCAGPRPPQPAVANAAPSEQATAVRVATVENGQVSTQIEVTGDVRPRTTLGVVPKQSGRIARLPVEVGDRVAAGDTLVELDKTSLQAQLEQAEAGVTAAQAKKESTAAGPKPGAVEQAQANARAAQQRLAALQEGGRPESVAQAQSQLDTAQARLNQVAQGGRPE